MQHMADQPHARWRLRALDSLAHFLYAPTMLGRRVSVARWHHRLHLIPGRVLERACARLDAALAPRPRVSGWMCSHLTITGPVSDVRAPCGCEMTPILAA